METRRQAHISDYQKKKPGMVRRAHILPKMLTHAHGERMLSRLRVGRRTPAARILHDATRCSAGDDASEHHFWRTSLTYFLRSSGSGMPRTLLSGFREKAFTSGCHASERGVVQRNSRHHLFSSAPGFPACGRKNTTGRDGTLPIKRCRLADHDRKEKASQPCVARRYRQACDFRTKR